jgi:molybdopterin-containing oxidoreductase family iron-sulfur binding subunit
MSSDCVEKRKAAEAQELVRIDTGAKLTLAEAKEKLAAKTGPRYWRSLHELADTPGFRKLIEDEFPRHAAVLDEVSRRDFMKVAAAGLALAGLTACTKQPPEAIVPFVRQPENMLPGRPAYFATAMPFPTGAFPLLAKSNEGRPTKVEGNPQHPASLGGSDPFAQASVLELYDPDRSQTIQNLGEVRPWGAFLGAVRQPLVAQKSLQGAGIRFLTETVLSPTLAAQMRDLLKQYPQAKWHQWDPVNRDAQRAGMIAAFGQPAQAIYKLEAADVIVSLDADFLSAGFPGFHRYAREFAARRKVQHDERGKSPRGMNRLYVIESTPSNTGGKADHRLAMRASEIESIARALANAVGPVGKAEGVAARFVQAVASDLTKHRATSLVIAGEHQSPAVHALAAWMNQALGNVGKTVVYTDSIEAEPVDQAQSLRELVADMRGGKVDMLVVVGGNPVYNAPLDFDFAGAIRKVPRVFRLGLYFDETSWLSHWHVPMAHYLESWSDTRAYDGTVSIVQPLIAPLYDGKTAHEFLTAFTDTPGITGYETLRNHWKSQHPGSDFEMWWRKSLHEGFIADSALPEKQLTVRPSAGEDARADKRPALPGELEVIFRPDPSVYDGRFSNNGWLQECPKPMTKLTWDNAALMSPATAKRLGIFSDSMGAYEDPGGGKTPVGPDSEGFTEFVTIRLGGAELVAAAWTVPGHPDDAVTLTLGYGRLRAGRVGNGAGYNAYKLRRSDAPLFVHGAEVRPTGERTQLAVTQHHQTMAGRDIVRAATLREYEHDPKVIHEMGEEPAQDMSLYPAFHYEGYAWGMSIDVNSCVGCNACVVACDAENNIPVVGKEQVIKEREMHWLRVDTYYEGEPENPRAYFQPVPCMQCENAPCEPVCPVGATVHSSEGLNDMVYNRCVGTRYCSNNCPYKVRRFNFLLYQDWDTPQLKMLRNPDVTVRSRGVMEKCTYCVQRINRGRIEAEKGDRKVQDGEIQTACQQACPADAIIFGNINDSAARVTALKKEHRNYGLLAELNTRPRTTYLAAIRNPNPELEASGEKKAHG